MAVNLRTAPGNFNTAAEWSLGRVPSSANGDTADLAGYAVTLDTSPSGPAIIDSGGTGLLTIASLRNFNDITISCAVSHTGSTCLVNTGKTLTIAGVWTTASGATIQNNAATSVIAIAATGNVAMNGSVVLAGGALTVATGGTFTWTPGATSSLNASTAGSTMTFAAGSIVTLCGQRVYVAGDSTDPTEAKVLTGTAYKINGASKTGTLTTGGGAPIIGSSIVRGIA